MASFLDRSQPVLVKIKSGYDYGPRTFSLGTLDGDTFTIDANTGFEARLEVKCVKGGEPVYSADSQDSGSGLTIDPDDILISFALDPSQTAGLDFSCCDFELFIYKGDADDPTSKKPVVHGEIRVS
jgi:hypothetical protein